VRLWEAGLTLDFHQSSPLPKGIQFGEYPANQIAFGHFGKNCANGSGFLLFRNSRWT